jgi:hypothetical protein
MPDEPHFEDWEPDSDEELVIATAEFCNIFGGCEHCTGIASVEQLRSRSISGELPPELDANQAVFCTHWCHEEAQDA